MSRRPTDMETDMPVSPLLQQVRMTDDLPTAKAPTKHSDRSRSDLLDEELWRRRQDRRDVTAVHAVTPDDAPLVPLVLALARLAAQRDAARFSPAT